MKPRLLIIDDDPLVAKSIRRGLKSEWDVVVIDKAREAVEALARGDAFDAILCDLVMPGMSGMDAYDAIVQANPGLASRIVFMTGGTKLPGARAFLDRVTNARLDKPFAMNDLRAALSRVLSGATAG